MIRKDRNFKAKLARQLNRMAPSIEAKVAAKLEELKDDLIAQVQKAMDDAIYSVDPRKKLENDIHHLNKEGGILKDNYDEVRKGRGRAVSQRMGELERKMAIVDARISQKKKKISSLWERTEALRDSVQFEIDGNEIRVFAGGELLIQLSGERLGENKDRSWPPAYGRDYAGPTAGNKGPATTYSGQGWWAPAKQLLKMFLAEMREQGRFKDLR